MDFSSAGHARQYYALSYVWGSFEETRPILVDGVSVRILGNLWEFLHGLRRKTLFLKTVPAISQEIGETQSQSSHWFSFTRLTEAVFGSKTNTQYDMIDISEASEVLLWADFLCINQSDLAERNSQVTMMASIFRQASAVIGWLGGSDSRQAAVELAKGMELPHYKQSVSIAESDRGAPRPEKLLVRNLQRALARLATDRYWTRLWIVQEIVLARRFWMLCHDVFLRWDDYTALMRYLSEVSQREEVELPEVFIHPERYFAMHRRKRPSPFVRKEYLESDIHNWYTRAENTNQSINNIRESLDNHQSWRYPEFSAFFIVRFVACGEPRDRVYGILGIIRPASRKLVKVDYDKSLLQVYFEGSAAFVDASDSPGTFFHILESLLNVHGPATICPESGRLALDSKVVRFPSSSDLSFMGDVQDLTFASYTIPRRVVSIEKVVVVLRRVNCFTVQEPQDCDSEEEILCFVYSLLTTRTQDTDINIGHARHKAAIVFAAFEIKVGDLFHDLDDSLHSSIVTRSRPQNVPGLDVLGTAFTPSYELIRDIEKYDENWKYRMSIPSPIRWVRNRIPGVRQKFHIRRAFPLFWQVNFVITLNAAAVMDHLENHMTIECPDGIPQVRVGRTSLTSLIEPCESVKLESGDC